MISTPAVVGPAVTTTVPAMTAMAPILPAVALGIVKAIFISKLLRHVGYTTKCSPHIIVFCRRAHQGDEEAKVLRIQLPPRGWVQSRTSWDEEVPPGATLSPLPAPSLSEIITSDCSLVIVIVY